MTGIADRPSTLPWPPILYCIAIVLAVALGWLVPLPWIGQPMSDMLFAIGLIVAAGGLALDIVSVRTLLRHRTTFSPIAAAGHLVTTGPYALSRNPIYLGNTLIMIGAGLASGIAWFLLLALVAAFATQKLAIEREERHLDARFGKRWRDYAKKVRRWI